MKTYNKPVIFTADPYYNLGCAIILQAIKDKDIDYFKTKRGKELCKLLGIGGSINEIIAKLEKEVNTNERRKYSKRKKYS